MLDDALQGTRTIDRIVALGADVLLGRFGQSQAEPLLGEALADAGELEIDDGGDFLTREAVEYDDLIDSVEELRSKVAAQGFGDLGFALLGVPLVKDELRADVGRHDQHGVTEIHG